MRTSRKILETKVFYSQIVPTSDSRPGSTAKLLIRVRTGDVTFRLAVWLTWKAVKPAVRHQRTVKQQAQQSNPDRSHSPPGESVGLFSKTQSRARGVKQIN